MCIRHNVSLNFFVGSFLVNTCFLWNAWLCWFCFMKEQVLCDTIPFKERKKPKPCSEAVCEDWSCDQMSMAGRAGGSGMSPAPHPARPLGGHPPREPPLGSGGCRRGASPLASACTLLGRLSRLDLALAEKGTQVCSHVLPRDSSPGSGGRTRPGVVTDCSSTGWKWP